MAKRTSKRAEKFLVSFSREHKDIRGEIARIIPEYNDLLEMHAVSFEEFALQYVAQQQGLPYEDPLFDYATVKVSCPKCGEADKITRQKDGSFQCSKCRKHYSANAGSISSQSNCSAATWLKVLHCIVSQFTVEQTTAFCGISPSTYYSIVVKLFYATSLLLQDMKLYGVIEADITFVHSNYRGVDLEDVEYPEGSIFEEIKYLPRQRKKRGGADPALSNKEKNRNAVAIFTAIDDRGHCFVRCAGLGSVTAKRLEKCIPRGCILDSVPDSDPFPYLKPQSKEAVTAPGERTLLVSDGELAIAKYASAAGIPHEAHVYRRKGKQVRLPEDAHNIQRVNALHSRLKKFLRGLNGVSTKYLPGYLTLFSFLECCGNTPEMIHRLFQLLARPGLGEPPEFYKSLFSVPNIYLQWQSEDNPLKNLSYRQRRAFYLYDLRSQQLKDKDKDALSMADIRAETGYSDSNIRRIYHNLMASGYADFIRAYFDETDGNVRKVHKNVQNLVCADPVFLAVYDAWAEQRQLPPKERMTLDELLAQMEIKYNRKFKRSAVQYHFKQAVKYGYRDPLPSLAQSKSNSLYHCHHTYLALEEEYRELQRSFRAKNLPIPPASELYAIIGERHALSAKRVEDMIKTASFIRSKQRRAAEKEN